MAKKKSRKKATPPLDERSEFELSILVAVARNQLRIVPHTNPSVRNVAAELGRPVTTVFQAMERLHEAELLAERPRPLAPLEVTASGFVLLEAYDVMPKNGDAVRGPRRDSAVSRTATRTDG